jgi:glutathione S-transferase
MKLYGHPLSSCTRKVLMLLAEKGAKADLITIDLFEHEDKAPQHLERHPFGVIPVLDEDGYRLIESRAILRYLDSSLPGPSFTPSSLKERARMDQWLSVDQSYIAPQTRTLAVQRILRKHRGLAVDPIAIEEAEQLLATALSVIDQALSETKCLAGDSFSLADMSLMPYVASLPMIGASAILSPLSHLSRWWERESARASWKVATSL